MYHLSVVLTEDLSHYLLLLIGQFLMLTLDHLGHSLDGFVRGTLLTTAVLVVSITLYTGDTNRTTIIQLTQPALLSLPSITKGISPMTIATKLATLVHGHEESADDGRESLVSPCRCGESGVPHPLTDLADRAKDTDRGTVPL